MAAQTVSIRAHQVFARSTPPVTQHAEDAKSKQAQLVVGQTIARDLKSGESHSYRVSLKAEQYANVVVEPQAIDVNVTVLDPAGKVIEEADWEREGSPESLWVSAEVTGDYEFKITATAHDWSKPRYLISLIKVEELRDAANLWADGVLWVSAPQPE